MRLFHSNDDPIVLPPGHRFPGSKYAAVEARVRAAHPELVVGVERASFEELGLVHAADYLASLREGTLSEAAIRRLGFPYAGDLVNRSRRSTGGTLAALAWAMIHGAAGHMAGGTHHAFADRGEGYCVFNDLAVATRVAKRDYGVRKVAIVDLDVHQGNGTAALFAGDDTVFTLSVHGAKNYPFVKPRGSLDVDLPDGCEDAEYLRALDPALEAVVGFRPELLFYQAGVDPLRGDRLGRLALSHAGLMARDLRVFALARRLRVPLVVTLGGGYGRNLDETIAAHANVYLGLVDELG